MPTSSGMDLAPDCARLRKALPASQHAKARHGARDESVAVKTHVFPAPRESDNDTLVWITLDGRNQRDGEWLADQDLDAATRESLWTEPKHNERRHLERSVFLAIVRVDSVTGADELIGLTLLVEAKRAIIVCYGVGTLIDEVLDKVATRTPGTGSSQLLPAVVIALVKPLEPEITLLTDRIDALEDDAMGVHREGLARRVTEAGRQVLAVRRYLEPMRDEMNFLAFNPDELPGATSPRHLRRAAEYLSRLIGRLDSAHKRVGLLFSQLRNLDEAHLARAMHKLMIVATVFLPLTFVTGLLGINVAGIPEAQNPTAFWLVCGFLLGVAVLALILIRWRRWM